MKTNITKIIAAIICSIVFASAVHTQEKPQPVWFDKITDSDAKDFHIVAAKIKKFIDRLAEEPSEVRGYIDLPANVEVGKRIKAQIDENEIVKNRVLFWGNLKYPENYPFSLDAGLYIIPPNAGIPARCILEPCECPVLSIDASTVNENSRSVLIYHLKAEVGDAEDITYQWQISDGEIIEGQATPTIKVDAKNAKEITATVEIGGLCEECDREASFTIKIKSKLELADEIGQASEEHIQALTDSFLAKLFSNPTARGYIIIYCGRQDDKRFLVKRERFIKLNFVQRRVDTSRITVIRGGYRETEAIEFWISTDDNQKPVPTPTVDAKFVGIPAAPKKSLRRKSK